MDSVYSNLDVEITVQQGRLQDRLRDIDVDEFPLVSVVIPYYNDREHINAALQSCIDNTYPNIEIFIIDDCSKEVLTWDDLTIDTTKHPITLMRNASNRGPGYSRNVGVRMARGDLIAFLDSDDIYMPTILEKQVKLFKSSSEVAWVYTDGYYLKGDKIFKKPNSTYHGFPKNQLPSGWEVNEYHLRGYNYMTFSSNMFKKSALFAVGLFKNTLEVSEDWDLFVRMAEKFPVHVISEPLMLYRIMDGGRAYINRSHYVEINEQILRDMYERQGLLPERQQDFDLAIAVIYQRSGIQRLNAGLNDRARYYLYHPKTAPIRFHFRMIALRILSLLPSKFYKMTLWIYDHLT